MIRVLFDHQIFSEQRYGGISRYFANLASEMNKDKSLQVKVAVLYVKNYYVRNFKQPLNNLLGRWYLRKTEKRYYWNKKYSKSLLKKSEYDIFHATYYDTYSLAYNRKPMVVTIHDMIYEHSPEMFVDAAEIISNKKRMMDAARAIIAISNFTKDQILKVYPQYASKTTVVYHGLPKEELSDQAIELQLPQRFILFVGERGHYKNFATMAKALAPLLVKEKELQLICVGGGEFTATEKEQLKNDQIADLCKQLNASDEELKLLYQQALVFVYPSWQEGFGLPMLEAFRNNCPIACSHASCLPEIGGDAVGYFDPMETDSILAAIKKIINEPFYANELRTKGQERLSHFSMEKCIQNTVQVYKNLLEQN